MPDIWQIYISSKNRSDNCSTANLLKAAGVPFHVVCEPQEQAAYAAKYPVIVLTANDAGFVFMRNSILDIAKNSKCEWFWMLDDDITGFYETIAKKTLKISPKTALLKAQDIISQVPLAAQGAFEYQQYAWSSTKERSLNSYCDVAVCINAKRARLLKFDATTGLKADRDFTLQVLASGFSTVKCGKLSFSAPANGSNKGGLQDVYKSGVEKLHSTRMAQKWGKSIVSVQIKPNGRVDAKINWRYFALPTKKTNG